MKLDIHDHPEGTIPEISGDEVIPMLASEIGEEVAAALIDCKIFQGNSDQPATIFDCEAGSTLVAVRTPDGRKRSFALRGAALLPTQSLVAVIDTYHGQRGINEETSSEGHPGSSVLSRKSRPRISTFFWLPFDQHARVKLQYWRLGRCAICRSCRSIARQTRLLLSLKLG